MGASAPIEIELLVPETLGNDFQSIMDQDVWRLHTVSVTVYVTTATMTTVPNLS
jgi:hypothetical protein